MAKQGGRAGIGTAVRAWTQDWRESVDLSGGAGWELRGWLKSLKGAPPRYDLGGRLLSAGRWTYRWGGEPSGEKGQRRLDAATASH